jgi:hypothetical protein
VGTGSSIQGKIFRDNVGKLPWAAGAEYDLQRLFERGSMPKEERAQREWHMSPYERGPGGNAPRRRWTRRLPNGGNTKVGQRGSGHLAVSCASEVAGLIKPAQRQSWTGDEAGGKPGKDGAYTNQRFKPLSTWEGPRKKAEVSNRTREIWPSGIIGGLRET